MEKRILSILMATLIAILSIPTANAESTERYDCKVTYTLDQKDAYINTPEGGSCTEISAGFTTAIIRLYDKNDIEIAHCEAEIKEGKASFDFLSLNTKPINAKCTMLSGSPKLVNGYIDNTNGIKGKIDLSVNNSQYITPTPKATQQPDTDINNSNVINMNLKYNPNIKYVSEFYTIADDDIQIKAIYDDNIRSYNSYNKKTYEQNEYVDILQINNKVCFIPKKPGTTTIKIKYATTETSKESTSTKYKVNTYNISIMPVGNELFTQYHVVKNKQTWNKNITKINSKIKKKYIEVSWPKVKGAKYEIYRQGDVSKYWIKIADTKQNKIKISQVKKGYNVKLKIRTYKKVKNTKKYSVFSPITIKTNKLKTDYIKDNRVCELRFQSEIMFDQINKERIKTGKPALKWSEELYKNAVAQSYHNFIYKNKNQSRNLLEPYVKTLPITKYKFKTETFAGYWMCKYYPENILLVNTLFDNDRPSMSINNIFNPTVYPLIQSTTHYNQMMDKRYKYSAVGFYGEKYQNYGTIYFDSYNCYQSISNHN